MMTPAFSGTSLHHFDVIIIGSGLAGLSAALLLAEHYQVAVITKRQIHEGSSGWAQGGIAAVLSSHDSFEAHLSDTCVAGAGLCEDDRVKQVVEKAPFVIDWLQKKGVAFTQEKGQLHLTREGGHSHRRIVHAEDATGAAIQNTLIAEVQAHPRITLFEHHTLVNLITKSAPFSEKCIGAYILDEKKEKVDTFLAHATILATGGAGKVYLYTTNPDTSTGDGIAAAWRAGCRVANMEFIQFHPTCLYHPHVKNFLISEAVRGEGGILKLPPHLGARAFMHDHHPDAELAPRDIVARAIDFEMKRYGVDYVHLDITHKGADFIQHHFPHIFHRCLSLGIDITQEPIPVVPAAHYTCGGIVVDEHGQTDVKGLYAIGETSYTGLHGANRLASNSLLECVVYAHACAHHIVSSVVSAPIDFSTPDWDNSQVQDPDEHIVIAHNWDELRRFMWDYVGIVRTNKRLHRAQHRLSLLQAEINEFYAQFHVSRDLLELRNLVQVADLIVQSALQRHESRGLHYSQDYPDMLEKAKPTILKPPQYLKKAL